MGKMYPWLLFFLISTASSIFGTIHMKIEETSCLTKTYKFTYLADNGEKVASVEIDAFPLSVFVVHTLYTEPLYRNHGYAKSLHAFVCAQLKKEKARRVFIQPGPFEHDRGIPVQEYDKRMQMLISFYKKMDFTQASFPLRICACIVYPLLGIKEEAQHLMSCSMRN